MPQIAIVGMACRFPDANSPAELWESVLAQRRAFRRIPPERLRLADYHSGDSDALDYTYLQEAAVIEGYEFDRARFRVARDSFESADMTHWLALEVAAGALSDAGFPDGAHLPRETTGVVLGNTLTGEFSRANGLRLRWPYVRRVVEAALADEGWAPPQRRAFLQGVETRYKAPFPLMGEETLAGGLSNIIAGRICNYFDLKGGGYTVDGACAGSLLAIADACSALSDGDLDVMVAGGVDLSLDPFELVGFARLGALAHEGMRIYDARSSGFWPGEGCGVVVLMRYDDALAQHRRAYAVIRGWGVSSDGGGGLTRPEMSGQLLALERAYRRAGFGLDSVGYFEGHGTGTAVGDATELRALSRARREAAGEGPPAAIGSVKANIGHTKAAAGVAGLMKAVMAVHTQFLPPTTGCDEPHAELTGKCPALRVLREGEPWPLNRPVRAGVSAMGFGGINAHVVIERGTVEQRPTLTSRERMLLVAPQDTELFVVAAEDVRSLIQRVERLIAAGSALSRAELVDLAVHLQGAVEHSETRAAVVASTPAELVQGLQALRSWLTSGTEMRLDPRLGVFLGTGMVAPRIGFLFPGQGSPAHLDGGALRRRFESIRELYGGTAFPPAGDPVATETAQPAIVTASVAGLYALRELGIEADVAVGHSLGELTALYWAEALDLDSLLRIARLRGRVMADVGSPTGAMASIAAGLTAVQALLHGTAVVIGGVNSPRQTVITGEAREVALVIDRAQAVGLGAVRLPVSHAFHSPLVAEAVSPLAAHLVREQFRTPQRMVGSTITGKILAPEEDLRTLLCRQVTSAVQFADAVRATAEGLTLWIEVGPGRVLSDLVVDIAPAPALMLPMDAGGPSLRGLLDAAAAAFVLGARVNLRALSEGRFARPFSLDRRPRFLTNPCELAPILEENDAGVPPAKASATDNAPAGGDGGNTPDSPVTSVLAVVRQMVAERVGLPVPAIRDDDRLLRDLHLNSISVGQLAAKAARRLGLAPSVAATEFANATVAELARATEERLGSEGQTAFQEVGLPEGIETWVRPYTVEMMDRPLPLRGAIGGDEPWRVIAPQQYPLGNVLRSTFEKVGYGGGVIVCLPPQPDERHVTLLLEGVRTVLAGSGAKRFILVQHGSGAAAFARTLHQEAPDVTACVVDLPIDDPNATARILAEAMSAEGFSEAHYDEAGRRREPVLRLLDTEALPPARSLGANDVLLATGGAKGITLECVLALAIASGARLILLGRSGADDPEVASNLERLAAACVAFRYCAADVTDHAAVRAAIKEAERELGPVTALLHGAGVNTPQLLSDLEEVAILSTLAPKLQGLRNVLDVIDPVRLRFLLTFSSIIGRSGMRGAAAYALANDWLSRVTENYQATHPDCRCIALEWSIWSGVGMGAHMGQMDMLLRAGVAPISPDAGVAALLHLLSVELPAVSVVVTGRYGNPPLPFETPELPLLRYLEHPRVHYPGVELVAEAELSTGEDPYLEDHIFGGERILPAVLGLEAMAQVVMGVTGSDTLPTFEQVTFARSLVVPERGSQTIRIAALVREPGRVEVAVRSAETAFKIDHFHATCRIANHAATPDTAEPYDAPIPGLDEPRVAIDPEHDLYGNILFHRGRFRRLSGYRKLHATSCVADIRGDGNARWFGHYLPNTLVLGDPGARDAAIHAVQACLPHLVLLPVGVDRLVIRALSSSETMVVQAHERSRHDDLFEYDVRLLATDGCLVECWKGLRLRAVDTAPVRAAPWAAPLLGPYVERKMRELVPRVTLSVVVEHGAGFERRERADRAIRRAIGSARPVHRRSDGKPMVTSGGSVSAAHAGSLTMAVAACASVACDMEPVRLRPAPALRDIVTPERIALADLVAHDVGEQEEIAATRVWSASECLTKAGLPPNAPLVLDSTTPDGWVSFHSGSYTVATYVAELRGEECPLVLAVLVQNG